jgi:hypothetical protein
VLDDNVSRAELADHKKEIFDHIDNKFNTVVDLIKDQGNRQDKVIDSILPSLSDLVIDKAKKDVYWKIVIFISSSAFLGVCGLVLHAFMATVAGS